MSRTAPIPSSNMVIYHINRMGIEWKRTVFFKEKCYVCKFKKIWKTIAVLYMLYYYKGISKYLRII